MSSSQTGTTRATPGAALARDLIDRVEELLMSAARAEKPIEVDPFRGRLFELFVMADATGFLEEEAEHDLTCDGVGRELAARWELAKHMAGGLSQAASLPGPQLARLRLLWSFMRMWMEWTYAWKRWDEFHPPAKRVP
jgi:hypothetical protein